VKRVESEDSTIDADRVMAEVTIGPENLPRRQTSHCEVEMVERMPVNTVTSLQDIHDELMQAAEAAAPQIAALEAVSEIFAVDAAQNAKVSCNKAGASSYCCNEMESTAEIQHVWNSISVC
jgi:hypothetical protein